MKSILEKFNLGDLSNFKRKVSEGQSEACPRFAAFNKEAALKLIALGSIAATVGIAILSLSELVHGSDSTSNIARQNGRRDNRARFRH